MVQETSLPVSSATSYELLPQSTQAAEQRLVTKQGTRVVITIWLDVFSEFCNRYWIVEIGSWVLGCACMIVIVAVLGAYDTKPVPQWSFAITSRPTHLTISLNAFVSLFATLSKAMMLVPLAESIGQLKWLWFERKHRPIADLQDYDAASRGIRGSLRFMFTIRKLSLVTLGALVFIGSLIISAFFQQLITTRLELGPAPGVAQVPRARSYSQRGPGVILGEPNLTLTMRAALYDGLMNGVSNPKSLDVVTSCPSGNCTFPAAYSSLAFCSVCTNITSTLVFDNTHSNATLPNGMVFNMGERMFAKTGTVDNATALTMDNNTLLMSLIVVKLSMIAAVSSPTATQCFLYICVNTYNGSFYNNEWTETLLDSTKVIGTGATASNNSWINNTMVVAEKISTSSPNQTFTIIPEAWVGLENVAGMFQGIISGATIGEASGSLDSVLALYYGETTTNGIYKRYDADIGLVMSNVARSMTKNLRENADPIDNMVHGQAHEVQAYLYVRWGWIALPAGLYAATLVLLLSTIVLTARSRVPVWKTSVYPLLRARVERADGRELELATELREMETALARGKVRLSSEPSKTTFVPEMG